MESPLGVKGEQEIRLVDCLPPPRQQEFRTKVSFFLYLSCFTSKWQRQHGKEGDRE